MPSAWPGWATRCAGCGCSAELKAGDASQPATWWDGRPFDAILLDAPCSASGIVRRHPDIRWLRRAADLPALAALQARLLDALWPLLKPGGRLLYATCSVFKCEGQAQIDAFLQRHGASGAALHPASPGHLLTVPDNRGDAAGSEVLHDGFYLALIRETLKNRLQRPAMRPEMVRRSLLQGLALMLLLWLAGRRRRCAHRGSSWRCWTCSARTAS